MKIALVTDAWWPQINGVVTTWMKIREQLGRMGHELAVVHPGITRTFPCPRYPEIRLAWRPGKKVGRFLEELAPDAVHIATEGPVGMAGRRWCRHKQKAFSTSYHTQFPLYLSQYAKIPKSISYHFLRRFHQPAAATLVPTVSLAKELEQYGFKHLVLWSRGVDSELFTIGKKDFYQLPKPIFVYCGRVAREKNLDAFLSLDLPGSKVVIGDGPDRERLARIYGEVTWCGYRKGKDLAAHLAGGDVFVFPSLTDTFGVVMLEAMACGLPVAAFPVTGPRDVVLHGTTGFLSLDLQHAALACLELDPQICRNYAVSFTWEKTTRIFLQTLALGDDVHLGKNQKLLSASRVLCCQAKVPMKKLMQGSGTNPEYSGLVHSGIGR